jgi:hypothetical protein
MTKHSYTITVEDADEAGRRLSFQVNSHDDIMLLAGKVGADDPHKLRLLLGETPGRSTAGGPGQPAV